MQLYMCALCMHVHIGQIFSFATGWTSGHRADAASTLLGCHFQPDISLNSFHLCIYLLWAISPATFQPMLLQKLKRQTLKENHRIVAPTSKCNPNEVSIPFSELKWILLSPFYDDKPMQIKNEVQRV